MPGHWPLSYPGRVPRHRSSGSFCHSQIHRCHGASSSGGSRYGGTEGALRGCEQHPLSPHCITVKRGTSTRCAKAGFLVCIVCVCSCVSIPGNNRRPIVGHEASEIVCHGSRQLTVSLSLYQSSSSCSNCRNGIPGCLTAPISTMSTASTCRRCRRGRRCLHRKVGCAERIISKPCLEAQAKTGGPLLWTLRI